MLFTLFMIESTLMQFLIIPHFFFELFYNGYATSLKVGIVKSGKTSFVFAKAMKTS